MNIEMMEKLEEIINNKNQKSLELENNMITESALNYLEKGIVNLQECIKNKDDYMSAKDFEEKQYVKIIKKCIDIHSDTQDMLNGNLFDIGIMDEINLEPIVSTRLNIKEDQDVFLSTVLQNIADFKKSVIEIYENKIVPYYENKDKEKSASVLFLKNKENNNQSDIYGVDMTAQQDFEHVGLSKGENFIHLNLYKNGEKILIGQHQSDYIKYSKEVVENYVEYCFRKRPHVGKVLKEKMIEENYNVKGTLLVADAILKNMNLLKNKSVDLMGLLKENKLEAIDDKITKIKYKNNIEKYANSIISVKYKDLLDRESLKVFKELYDIKLPAKEIQEKIGKKLAGFHTSEDFNSALVRLLNSYNDFDKESYLRKANNFNAPVVVNDENLLILRINDAETSAGIGSPSWCISRSSHYFEDYTRDNKEQYFVYDFDQTSSSNKSMIGITLKEDKKQKNLEDRFYVAHIKNDHGCDFKDCEHLVEKIVIAQKKLKKSMTVKPK
jgi:hypothetical protein